MSAEREDKKKGKLSRLFASRPPSSKNVNPQFRDKIYQNTSASTTLPTFSRDTAVESINQRNSQLYHHAPDEKITPIHEPVREPDNSAPKILVPTTCHDIEPDNLLPSPTYPKEHEEFIRSLEMARLKFESAEELKRSFEISPFAFEWSKQIPLVEEEVLLKMFENKA